MLDVKARKKKWVDFLDISSPVNRLVTIGCSEGMPAAPLMWWENEAERLEWSYVRYQRQMEHTFLYDDHLVPHLSVVTGTEIFAEAFGCRVHKPLNNMPFALLLVHNAKEAAQIKTPRLEDTHLMRLFEMARRLKDRAGQDALLNLPDIQTPADVAALIWDKNDFYWAMIEEPDAVKALIAQVREFMFEFLDRWFEMFGRETIAHYPDYYMPYGITVSEDEIGIVGCQLFEEFFAEDLAMLSERYGQIGIHCCADSKHQWENLKKVPNLKLINLVHGREDAIASLPVFRDTCAQMPNEYELEPEALPGAERMHICYSPHLNTVKEAQEFMKRFYDQYPYMAE